ncbi:MAG: hypothetical protein AAF253_04220 [Pseudomonadota bacterium]
MASSDYDVDPQDRPPPMVVEARTLFPHPSHEAEIEYKRVGLSTASAILLSLLVAALAAGATWFFLSGNVSSLEQDKIRLEAEVRELERITDERDRLVDQLAGLGEISRGVAEIEGLEQDIEAKKAEIADVVRERRSRGASISQRDATPPETPDWNRETLILELGTAQTSLRNHLAALQRQRDSLARRAGPQPRPCTDPENC